MRHAFGSRRVGSRPRLNNGLRATAFATIAYCTVAGVCQPVQAQPPLTLDDVRSALVQPSPAPGTGFHQGLYQDDSHSALRDFVEAVSDTTSQPGPARA